MPCVLVIEACGGVHFQGDIRKLARDVYFVPSACVKAFVKRKNINVAGPKVICEVSYHLKAVMTEADDTFSIRDERAETGPRNTLLGPCSANPLTYATDQRFVSTSHGIRLSRAAKCIRRLQVDQGF